MVRVQSLKRNCYGLVLFLEEKEQFLETNFNYGFYKKMFEIH